MFTLMFVLTNTHGPRYTAMFTLSGLMHTHPHVYKLSHTHGPRYGDIVTMPSGLDDHIANGRLDSHITRLAQWLRKDTNWQVKLSAPETDDW